MHVLGNMVGAVRPGGVILDLQVVRPNPRVEVDGRFVCELDGAPLFRKADAAVSIGLCCIAVLGVWNWRGTSDWGGKTALPDWEMIAFKDARSAGRSR